MIISNILVKSSNINSNIARQTTIIDWSHDVHLLFAEENSVAGEDDVEGDAGGGGTKSSMSGEGRAQSN